SVHQGEVNAVFLSHQAGVRDAIVAAMPRLRAQMDASGMTLGQAQVSSDNSGRQSGQSQPGYTFSYHSGAGRMADNNSQGFALAFSALGLVDMFV
ncbi:MAG: flagellar hook-length control protein FliK, partial [Pseudomonadota bacterium]|nr:flagellar hook-length control protein FliK [Pseudomonadota bacterium]